jgi:surface carbohydrate biosynthesis protein
MNRVCLLVDHTLRDLDGLVHLGRELARRGVEAFLVPMYQRNEVFLLRPDVVVVNYVRFANAGFVRACAQVGIAVAVLDTEGGVQQDVAEYAKKVAGYLDHVGLYCAWGEQQANALAETGALHGLLRVTGCPRYDFAAPAWRAAVRDPAVQIDHFVLVNTNFPILRPRFQSREQEVHQLVNASGYDADFIARFIEQAQHARAELIRSVRQLALRFTHLDFVIRPHPFEDLQTYATQLQLPNVHVIQSGSVLQWISRALVVIHYNCSTAVEAFLMEKPPIMPVWIEAPLLAQPISRDVTLSATSFAELEDMVAHAARGERLAVSRDVQQRRDAVLRGFFAGNDGQAATRVCDALLELMAHHFGNSRSWAGSYARDVVGAQGSWQGAAQMAITMTLGPAPIRLARRLARRGSAHPGKSFGTSDVTDVLHRLAAADPNGPAVQVEPAGRRLTHVTVGNSLTSIGLRSSAHALPGPVISS